MNYLLGRLTKKVSFGDIADTSCNRNATITPLDSGDSDNYFDTRDLGPKYSSVEDVDIGNGIGESSNMQKNATLAYNLDLLLLDSSALSFFIQFLESCDKLNLIKFWMHVEGFKASVNNCQVENSEVAVQSLSLLDARNIFEKYIDDDSSSTISLPRKIKHRIDENLTKQPLKVDCFDDAQHFVRQLFELRYFPEFQVSIYYKKHELFVLSRGCSLFDIIHVQFLLLSFLEYIDLRTDHDRLQFLIACESFENNLESLSDEDALNDAMSIYDKYFSMQAPNPINLGCAERTEMESLICTVAGRPSPASFRTAKQLCANILHDKYLHRFIHSSAYHSYLVDLSAQIQNTVELPRPSCTRQCTNSSSDGFSSNDSLPLVFRRHFENLERVASVRTPTQSPKTIKNKNVNLAEIDSLGRYRTLYDDSLSLQEGNASSKFRQRLRKYLDKETLREEEIAEEVARTIIDDVHKMVEAGKRD